MKLIDILSGINPILRILLIIVLTVASHFAVKAIRRFSQYLLTMKVDSEAASEANLTRKYPKIATIITILVSAVTFTIYFVAVGMVLRENTGKVLIVGDRIELNGAVAKVLEIKGSRASSILMEL